MESILDDLSLRTLTQSRPSPELTRLSPKSFIALPLRTQIAYLLGRWMNPSKSLTRVGIDLIEIRRAQIRLWTLLTSLDIPSTILDSLHFALLEADSSTNLINLDPPKLASLEKLIQIREPSALR